MKTMINPVIAGVQEVREQGDGDQDPRQGGPLRDLAQGGRGGERRELRGGHRTRV